MTTVFKYVLDTSVCIKYFIADPLTPKVIELFTHLAYPQTEMFVPDLFYIECTNVFMKYVRANMYTSGEVQADLATLKNLQLQVVPTANLMDDAVNIALNYNISAYDASYVTLSQQNNAPLLTLDKKLVKALAASSFNICLFNEFQIPPLPNN
ncbi:type II toxin-antitoxin system VapC family toxin [Anabaena cylindrica FACHB-243]|uniref:PilT protein domain protein n=1 Tax=Anabaena cylindrica (strain ATCC 27899 / PCC 7122) TaxID=272123 RepID=K9ZPS5_ANACC|nr:MULTISPECIES: type II toxin-antitoxin system VapC family toxin [Anabaena]AFZ60794.1 PilT protein domain protein [Anabaena cylindrica PCC 7122]MBD2417094.1 type II toxin-antitoxin system VapC family toxin [Anabaena cylindrica FACHB-243]MBY5280790.1 type II toxin-antitoxin system VapC family toxin [Anabaena sp. CCAP 1446/1C]MBY5307066.1 type II toxin-antitoxin system VapC family toxin [Anabaena sp. CCAP 1446/1C]MCM2406795.1 type II toxin-antitoxin system VapC family toxin [Anabaena sp. CCAP 1